MQYGKLVTLANGSISSLYGCIGYAVREKLLSNFPSDFFKYTSMSTEIATRNIFRQFGGNNTDTEIVKRVKPYLLIQPTYATIDSSEPLQGVPLTSTIENLQFGIDRRMLFPVIIDKEYGYNLKFKMNRDRVDFDITITLSTLHQQLDLYKMLQNTLTWDFSTKMDIPLEAVIPKSLIKVISKYCDMDIEVNDNYIPILTHRLNSIALYPITYKMRNATYNDEWFMYYTHSIIMTFSELSMDTGSMKNMAPDSYNITFKVTADFNLPGLFIIDTEAPAIPKEIRAYLSTYSPDGTSAEEYIPLFTLRNINSRYPYELNGMTLYGSTIFHTEAKDNIYDIVSFSSIFESEYLKAVNAHQIYYPNSESLCKFIVVKNDKELIINDDYLINWNSSELKILRADDTATYRLIVYFNIAMLNELVTNSEYQNRYDISKLRTNVVDNTVEDKKVTVFDDQNEGYVNIVEPEHNIYLKSDIPEDYVPDKDIIINPDRRLGQPTEEYPEGSGVSDFSIGTYDSDSLTEDVNFVIANENNKEVTDKMRVHPSLDVTDLNDGYTLPPSMSIGPAGFALVGTDQLYEDVNFTTPDLINAHNYETIRGVYPSGKDIQVKVYRKYSSEK